MLRVAQEDGAEGVAADAVLAAQEEALEDRDLVAGEGLDPAGFDVDGEQRLRGIGGHRPEDAVRRLGPPEVVVAAHEAAGVLHGQGQLLAAGGFEGVVPAVIGERRPQRRVVDPQLGDDDVARLVLAGRRRGLAGHERRDGDGGFVVVVGPVVADAGRVEQPVVAAVGEDRALAVAQIGIRGTRQQVVLKALVVGPDADALRPVEEPGHRVGEVEEVAQPAALQRQPHLLAAAEEVLGVDGELAEEAVQLAPAAAELQLGAVRLRALEGQVDLLLLGVGVDLDRVLLVELEVPELVDLEDAVADRRHVHQAAGALFDHA